LSPVDVLTSHRLELEPLPCDDGHYQPHPGQTTCLVCPEGHSCLNGAEALPCLAGTASTSGQANCTACDSGTFSQASGSETCTSCPAGYRCGYAASAASECGIGSYSVGGSSQCTPCPAGTACASNTTETPTACTSGNYSLAGSSACTVCPAGSRCPIPSVGKISFRLT
jgi:hypothetical protein